jgi:amidohydrolase
MEVVNFMNSEMVDFMKKSIDSLAIELVTLSSDIWGHPEIGHKEFRTSKLLCDSLERHGFLVERGVAEMPTAFVAHKGSGSPNICFTAEYDALPGLGHACGHNLFCCSAIAGAAAFADWISSRNFSGTATVIGSPAEEGGAVDGGGCKVVLVEKGFFRDVDIAMISHADGSTVVERRLNAGVTIEVTFNGKPAHAGGSPERGINALTAGMLFINNINSCRQQFKALERVNPVICSSSSTANTIPDLCVIRVNLRAYDQSDLDELIAKVDNCIKAATLVSGCKEEHHHVSYPTSDLVPNHSLAQVWRSSLEELGVKNIVDSDRAGFCWDMGNVSHYCPTIAPYMTIGPKDLVGHTPEFRECANSKIAHTSMLNAAKAMAMTAATYASDLELRHSVRKEFQSNNVSV